MNQCEASTYKIRTLAAVECLSDGKWTMAHAVRYTEPSHASL